MLALARRVFSPGDDLAVARVREGVSTYVYRVVPLPSDSDARIALPALLIGVRLLARSIERRGITRHDASALWAIRHGIAALA